MLTKNNGAVSAERNKSLYIHLNKDMTYPGLGGVKLKVGIEYTYPDVEADGEKVNRNGFYIFGLANFPIRYSPDVPLFECSIGDGFCDEFFDLDIRCEKITLLKKVGKKKAVKLLRKESNAVGYDLVRATMPTLPIDKDAPTVKSISPELFGMFQTWADCWQEVESVFEEAVIPYYGEHTLDILASAVYDNAVKIRRHVENVLGFTPSLYPIEAIATAYYATLLHKIIFKTGDEKPNWCRFEDTWHEIGSKLWESGILPVRDILRPNYWALINKDTVLWEGEKPVWNIMKCISIGK